MPGGVGPARPSGEAATRNQDRLHLVDEQSRTLIEEVHSLTRMRDEKERELSRLHRDAAELRERVDGTEREVGVLTERLDDAYDRLRNRLGKSNP